MFLAIFSFVSPLSDSDVQSHEKDSDGHPLLQLSPPTVYVRSFSQLSKLLHLADDKKLAEVRACLEGKFGSNLHPKQSKHQHSSITHRLNLFVLLVTFYSPPIMLPLVILYRYVFTFGPLPTRDTVIYI